MGVFKFESFLKQTFGKLNMSHYSDTSIVYFEYSDNDTDLEFKYSDV